MPPVQVDGEGALGALRIYKLAVSRIWGRMSPRKLREEAMGNVGYPNVLNGITSFGWPYAKGGSLTGVYAAGQLKKESRVLREETQQVGVGGTPSRTLPPSFLRLPRENAQGGCVSCV